MEFNGAFKAGRGEQEPLKLRVELNGRSVWNYAPSGKLWNFIRGKRMRECFHAWNIRKYDRNANGLDKNDGAWTIQRLTWRILVTEDSIINFF